MPSVLIPKSRPIPQNKSQVELPPQTPIPAQEVKPHFSAYDGKISQQYKGLKAWWSFFNDPVLNSMISSALSMNAAQLAKKEKFPENEITQETLMRYYKNKHVELISNIAKDYIEYRYTQMQASLLNDYSARLEYDLEEIYEGGAGRIKTELGFLRGKKQEFAKKLQKLSLSLSKTTRLLPEYIDEVLKDNNGIPDYDITPIMASSALSITGAADIDVARNLLYQNTRGKISLRETQNIFPDIWISRFFGISDNIFVDQNSSWRIKIGHAQKQVMFSALKLEASTKQQIQEFKSSVESFVSEIEAIMISTATLRDQQKVLQEAAYKAAQEESYKAHMAVLRAQYEKAKIIIKLFERLDIY